MPTRTRTTEEILADARRHNAARVPDVLREHRDVCGDGSLCECGWQRPLAPGASTPGPGLHLRHVESALAAAGLLATVNHDIEVAHQTLAAVAAEAERQGVPADVTAWLTEWAARIAVELDGAQIATD